MKKMKSNSQIRIVDITEKQEYENYLYRCLAPMPFRRYARRQEYLQKAIPKGFRKKLLIFDGNVVGTIEYAPAEASGYPITGNNVIAMNCIWVLRKAKGHNFGKLLMKDMMKNEKNASGFATIALEDHWSPWFEKWQMEKLGFKPIDSISVTHKTKHEDQVFTIYLMWMPKKKNAKPPTMNWQKLLQGETFCMAHTLHRPQTWKESILELKQ